MFYGFAGKNLFSLLLISSSWNRISFDFLYFRLLYLRQFVSCKIKKGLTGKSR